MSKTITALAIGCAGIAISAAIQAFVIEHWHIVLFGSRYAGMPFGAIALAVVPASAFLAGVFFIGVKPGMRVWLSSILLGLSVIRPTHN